MKTLKKQRSSLGEVEKNALLLRLERNQKDVSQLRESLNSYRCEPRTYGLFEHIESLRNGLERFSRSNLEIINSFREQKKSVGDFIERAKQQLSEFNQLQNGVEAYREKCLGY